jgi:hypothetical protein
MTQWVHKRKWKRFRKIVGEKWFSVTLFFRFNWLPLLLIASLVLLVAYWWRYLLPSTDLQAAQWSLSAEVQGLAALLGIILVGVTILWSQAMSEETRLRELQQIYYELLRTGGNQKHLGAPFIELLRRNYLKAIEGRTLPRAVFPYEHRKYQRHRDLFLDICRLSQVVFEHYGLPSNSQEIQNDLGGLGFSENEITYKVLVTLYDLKSDAAEFLELVTDIFNPANTTLNELEGGGDFGMKVWDETLKQATETSLGRLKRFHRFRGIWFRFAFALYVLAIATGLIALSATDAMPWRPWLIGATVLGFLALGITVVFFHQLLRAK